MTGTAEVPIKRSIALVIVKPDRKTGSMAADPKAGTRWLLVLRPDGDPELPATWGLPAGSYREEESDEDVVRRIGRDKLGIEVEGLRPLSEGLTDREHYRLSMVLYAARIVSGEPRVPQSVEGVTQYSQWAWRLPAALRYGAKQGSLCCRLALDIANDK